MASQVEICNIALSSIGKSAPISSLNEASEEAKQCKLHYPHALRYLLQRFDYFFARKVKALAAVANARDGNWLYAYSLPNDRIRIFGVKSNPDLTPYGLEYPYLPFEVAGDVIYSNLPDAHLEYGYLVEDPSKFPPSFVDALAWQLAARIVYPLTKNSALRQEMLRGAETYRILAEADSGNQEQNFYTDPTSPLDARGGYHRPLSNADLPAPYYRWPR